MDVRSGLQNPGNFWKKAVIMQFHDLFNGLRSMTERSPKGEILDHFRRLIGGRNSHSHPRKSHRRFVVVDSLEERLLLSAVAVFDNGTYVDTAGGSGSESDTIQASLSSLGHSVTTFTGLTAASFTAGLSGKDALLIPEQENSALAPALDVAAKAAIQNFVANGGGLIISADYAGFLNGVFGFGLSYGSSSTASLTPAAAGTAFAGGPASLPPHSQTIEFNTATLPAGSATIYSDGAGSTVALIPYGAGTIVSLGWDWFDAAPLGSQNGGWLTVLGSAVSQAANSAQTSVALSGGNLVVTDIGGGNSNDNWSFAANGTNLTITDNNGNAIGIVGTILGSSGTGTPTVTIPLSSFPGGKLIVNSLAGNDSISLGMLTLLTNQGIDVLSGTGTDTITVNGTISSSGGNVSLTATNGVTLSGANADIMTSGGTFIVDADSDLNGTGTFTSDNGGCAMSTSGGIISITAADVALSGTLASTSTVTLLPSTAGSTIGLGGAAGTFNLTDSEADLITAGRLEIGTATAGAIKVDNLSLANANVPTLVLRTGANVTEGTGDSAADITVTNLAIVSATGINLDVDVTTFAVGNSGAGGVDITDTAGGATVGSISTSSGNITGVSTNGGGVTIVTNSPLVVNADVVDTAGGNITLTAAGSASSYYPFGPQANVSASFLASWTPFYVATMAQPLPSGLAAISALSNFTYWMMAGRVTGSSTYTVLAAAPKSDVLFVVPANNTTHNANGSEWYYTDDWSWGFANAGDSVIRNSADILSTPNGNLRMSLHTHSGVGGYRVGTTQGLNGSIAFEKVLLGTNSLGGGSAADDVALNANVTASGGNGTVTINAANDILQNSGTVSVVGSGAVAYNAGTDTSDGVVTMGATSAITAQTGAVTLVADGEITIAEIDTTTGNVTATSSVGGITVLNNAGGIAATGAATITLNPTTAVTVNDPLSAVGGAIVINGGGSVTDSIQGSGTSFTKLGSGALNLSATNTFTGATNINAGTLRQSVDQDIINQASTVTVASGATFDLNSFAEDVGALAGAGSVTLGGAGGTLSAGANNASTTFSGTISGAGTVTKAGTGIWTLSGTNTYTGATNVNAGTLLVNGLVTSNVAVGVSGTLGGNGTITGNVTGAGIVAPGNSAGILTIVGNFTPTGTVVFEVNPPAVTAGTDYDQINVTGLVNLSGATLTFAGSAGAVSANRLVSLILNDASDSTTASTNPAQGSVVMINGNSYKIFYNGGDGNDVVLVENSTPTVVYVDDSFTQSDGTPIGDADLGTTGSQSAIKGITAFATINAALATVTTSGTIIVNGGTYAETVSLTGTRTLRVTGPDSAQTVIIDDLTTIAGTTVAIEGSSNLTVGDADSRTLAGVISGSGSFTKQGAGTYTLSGANAYAGNTTVSAGTLQLGNASALGTTAGGTTVSSGAVLDLNGQSVGAEAVTLNGTGISSGGALINSSGSAASLAGNITLASASSIGGSGNATYSGTVNGGFGLTLVGAGTKSFTGIVGGGTPLTSITQNDATGAVRFDENVTVSSGGATFNANVTLDGLTLTSGGPVTIGNAATDTLTISTTSTTITTTSGNITLNSTTTGNQNLTLNSAGGVSFNAPVNMDVDKTLAATSTSTTVGITLPNTNSDITTTGTGSVNLTAARNIALSTGSSVSTVNGGITMSANAAGTSAGNFVGLELVGADVQTTGMGKITLTGKGAANGNLNNQQLGTYFKGGTTIRSTATGATAGTIAITGTGGNGTYSNFGVFMESNNTAVTSVDGDITILGTGGNGLADSNFGVYLAGIGSIASSGIGLNAADIQITGNGGSGTFANIGVQVFANAMAIASADGNITISGTGGISTLDGNDGIVFSGDGGAQITSGILSISGTAGSGNSNGVLLDQSTGGGLRTVGVGSIVVNGTGNGTGSDFVAGADSVIGGVSAIGPITITANTVDLGGTLNIQSAGALTLLPRTAGTTIGLGGGTGILNISDAELGLLADGFSSITIGNATAGNVDIDTASFKDPVNIVTGATIHDHTGTDINAGTNSVTLSGIIAPGQSPGILTIAGNLTFVAASTYEVEIGGATAGTGAGFHDQIDVTGTVIIGTNVSLSLLPFGGFVPTTGNAFVIVNNDEADAVTGEFAGLPEGTTISTNFLGSGLGATISYKGGTGNDVVIKTAGFTVSKTTTTTAEGSTNSFTVVLNTPPTSNVVIDISSGNLAVANVNMATLTFTPLNWNVPQTVTVTGVDDTGGPATLTLSVNGTLSDDGFDNLPSQTVMANVTNVAPTLSVSAPSINENGTSTLSGTLTDPGLLDTHDVDINWADTNDTTNAHFDLPAIFTINVATGVLTQQLFAGNSFNSTTEDSVLKIVSVNNTTGVITFTVAHQYLDDGVSSVQPGGNGTVSDASTISVTVTDDDLGTVTQTASVTVSNVGPTLSISAPNINENGTTTLSGTLTDIGLLDTHDVDIKWGDSNDTLDAHFDIPAIFTINIATGVLTQQLFSGNTFNSTTEDSVLKIVSVNTTTGVINFTVGHQYLDDGLASILPGGNSTAFDVSTISATVADDDLGTVTKTTTVTVSNVAPTAVVNAAMSTLTINEQGAAVLSGTITDPGTLDVLELKVNWGDPFSPDNIQTFVFGPPHVPGSGTRNFTLLHTYRDDNPSITSSDVYTITLNVSDDDLGSSGVSTTVRVNNVAPTANPDGPDAAPALGQPLTTDEDTPFVTPNILANDIDPAGSLNPLKGTIDDVLKVIAINGLPAVAGNTVTLPSGAKLTINANGTLSYNPNNAFFSLALGQMAQDIFSYTIDDGDSGTSTASVTITIIGNNDIWVDVNNDCIYDPGAGDIDVTSLAEDGIFNARYSTGFYRPVPGAGLGINAVLNLPGSMNFTADGMICVLHSELMAAGTITLLSCIKDIRVIDSVINGKSGIDMTSRMGTITVNAGSTLIATGTASADIILNGSDGVDVSGATLTASDDIFLGNGACGTGGVLANGTTATAADIQIWSYGNFEAMNAVFTATNSIRLESRTGSGDISGAALRTTGPKGVVKVTSHGSLLADPGLLPTSVTATAGIFLRASYGPLQIANGQLQTTSPGSTIRLQSAIAINAQRLTAVTPGFLSLLVNSLERSSGFDIHVEQANLRAGSLTINARDSVYANSLRARTTSGDLSLKATYHDLDVTNSVLNLSRFVKLEASQGTLTAVDSVITARPAGASSITASGQSYANLSGARWTAPASITVSLLGPGIGSAGLLQMQGARLRASAVTILTRVEIQADSLVIAARNEVSITAIDRDIRMQSALINASNGTVSVSGHNLNFSPLVAAPVTAINGYRGVTLIASAGTLLAPRAVIRALSPGADVTLYAHILELPSAIITANDALIIDTRYEVGTATSATINVANSVLVSNNSRVDIFAVGSILADSARISAVNLVSLYSSRDKISAVSAVLRATASNTGRIQVESCGQLNLNSARLTADRIQASSSDSFLDALDAVFAVIGGPSQLDIFAADDIHLQNSSRAHAVQFIRSSRGTVVY